MLAFTQLWSSPPRSCGLRMDPLRDGLRDGSGCFKSSHVKSSGAASSQVTSIQFKSSQVKTSGRCLLLADGCQFPIEVLTLLLWVNPRKSSRVKSSQGKSKQVNGAYLGPLTNPPPQPLLRSHCEMRGRTGYMINHMLRVSRMLDATGPNRRACVALGMRIEHCSSLQVVAHDPKGKRRSSARPPPPAALRTATAAASARAAVQPTNR